MRCSPWLFLMATACSSPTLSGGERSGPDGATVAGSNPDLSPQGGPPAAEQLAPAVKVLTDGGSVREVTIEFARAVRPLQKPLAGTRVRLEPMVRGTLRYATARTLVYRASHPLKPGSEYTLVVESVATSSGVVAPARPWRHTFTTPAFQLVGIKAAHANFGEGIAEVDANFSAPFHAADLARFATWSIAGRSVSTAPTYRPGTDPRSARVTLVSDAIVPHAEVELMLAPGLPYDILRRTPGGTARTKLSSSPPAKVLAVTPRPNATGFHLDVVCNDQGAGHQRSWWDPLTGQRFYVSRRCFVDPDVARTRMRFEPPIDFTIAQNASGFRVAADFARGDYTLHIDADTPTVDGGHFPDAHAAEVSFPERPPFVQFQTQGRYLPRKAWSRLPLRHLNVAHARLTIRHVRPENVVFWLTGSDERASDRTADLVVDAKVDLQSATDTPTSTSLDLADYHARPDPGVYEISLRHGDARDVRRLLLSDMHLLVKRAAPRPGEPWSREAWTWVVDAHDGRPLGDVEVSLVQPSGRAVARCRTPATGGCRLRVDEAPSPDAPEPFAVIARRGRDVTYLKFDELRTEAPGATTYGAPYHDVSPYRAAAYTDRGVYRPGETTHLVAVVRDQGHRAPPAGMPVALELNDPRRRVAQRLTARTNAAGLVSFDLPHTSYAATGAYDAVLTVADREVSRRGFQVEAFVPERLKVVATPAVEALVAGAAVKVHVAARYLFGGSAEGSAVKATCRVHAGGARPRGLAGYTLGVPDAVPSRDLDPVEGVLDAEGKTTLTCPPVGAVAQTARVAVEVAVFEAGSGRSTVDHAHTTVHPTHRYLALRSDATEAAVGEDFQVDGRVVDLLGELDPTVTEVAVERVRLNGAFGWFVDERSGRERWMHQLRPTTESTTRHPVRGGRFTLTVRPLAEADRYIVRVRAGDAVSELHLAGDVERYDWVRPPSTRDTGETPRPAPPTALRVSAPDRVEVGARVPITFEAPFRGRALVTVETDRVVRWGWVTARPGQNSWAFQLDEFAPNVYVGVLLTKDPHLESPLAYVPDRAFGVRSVAVVPERFTRALRISAPKEVRPHQTLEIDLDVGRGDGPTFVTVAAVDQGILSLTGFTPPDPIRDLLARRALGVDTFETIGWALRLGGQPAAASGGGADTNAPLGSSAARPVKPVSLWSGVVEVPASGKATVRFEVPQYRGVLRVMAVAAGRTRVGAASTQVLVRDPLVLQTTLPRFLVGGDEVEMPVFVTNLVGADRDVTVSLAGRALATAGAGDTPAASPLALHGDPHRTVHVADGASARVVFRARALAQVGGAEIRVEARSGDITSHDSVEVPFRSPSARQRAVREVSLLPGARLDLAPRIGAWLPGTERTTIWATTMRHAAAFQHLRHLVRYPYGCVEQTTSSARPLLFVGDLLRDLGPDLLPSGGVDAMVAAGVTRLLSMQTPSGGLAYWPGSLEPDAWGTAYATHFLLDARDAGHQVAPERLDRVVDWIERSIDTGAPAYAAPYLHFVLARAGRDRAARAARLADMLGGGSRSDEAAFLARAAVYLGGDRRHEALLRSVDLSAVAVERLLHHDYHSDLRGRGLVLATRVDLFGADDPQAAALADVVGGALGQASHHYNTQELMWGVTGLGKYARAQASKTPPPTLSVNGRVHAPRPPDANRGDRVWIVPGASEQAGLVLEAAGDASTPVTVVLSSEGIPKGGTQAYGGDGLALTREWLDVRGAPLAPKDLELGTLVYVRLTLKNTTRRTLENLALVDRFPAGWEVENPRLGRGTLPRWVDPTGLWAMEHMNVRDDRVEIFGGLAPQGDVQVVYALRAVSAGTFLAPPASAEAMYDPRVWARVRPAAVSVRGPWGVLVD